MRSASGVAEIRALIERCASETAQRILAPSTRRSAPPKARTAVNRLALVHGRRLPQLGRAP